MTKDELIERIIEAHPDFKIPDLMVVGIRGYYKKTMGFNPDNERNLYDDAMFIVGNDDFEAFNANTDPSAFKLEIANLKAGIWPCYTIDKHRGQYFALCQRGGPVTVIRDGKGEETGYFGINIHRGGNWKTSSLGCQTIPPSQYDSLWLPTLLKLARKYMGKSYRSAIYTYVLLEN